MTERPFVDGGTEEAVDDDEVNIDVFVDNQAQQLSKGQIAQEELHPAHPDSPEPTPKRSVLPIRSYNQMKE